MAFKSYKVNIATYNGSGCADKHAYCDYVLNLVKTAFLNADASWSQEGTIEYVSSDTSSSGYFGHRTLQLKNSTTNKYLRIWMFAGCSYSLIDSPSTNTSTSLEVYTGNTMKLYNTSMMGNLGEIFFGVSDHSIDADFAKDLGLTTPIFSVCNNTSTSNRYLSYSSSANMQAYGVVLTVISYDKMFAVFEKRQTGDSPLIGCIYADDMFICANSGDTETAGVVSCVSYDQTYGFCVNSAGGNNAQEYLTFIFNQKDGGFDFRRMGVNACNNGFIAYTTEASTKMVTAPLAVWSYPTTYSGSSQTGVVDGIGFKGWVNTDYIRCVNETNLPATCKGLKYASGRWLCVQRATLICWDDSNSSPFEAAT